MTWRIVPINPAAFGYCDGYVVIQYTSQSLSSPCECIGVFAQYDRASAVRLVQMERLGRAA